MKPSKRSPARKSAHEKKRQKAGKSRQEIPPASREAEKLPAPPAHAADGPACLDLAVLAELKELGGPDEPEFLPSIIAEFIEDASRRLDDLHAALRSGDAAALERAAHVLKGSSAHFGAAPLARVSEDLQEKGRNGVLEGAVELVVETEKEFQRVRRALESYR